MRKSSLGRRSSTHIPVRVPSLGSSGQRICSGEKRSQSLLKQPGFSSQGYRRSQSEDRESYGGRPMSSNVVRSNTAGTLPGRSLSSTTPRHDPVTPRTSIHSNLPIGSTRAPRQLTMSTESNRRMSSFGGTKNSRKDSRPLSEKSFQQAAQAKVQQYFDLYASDIIGPGNSVRPMNTKLFVDMMDHLLKNLDNRTVITKSNYLEELPVLLRKLGYRSKVDRSWLMTVNTPHSWQHVIGILSWLVDVVECMNCVDPFEMMFGNGVPEPNDNEDDEENITIDKEFICYVKKTYKMTLSDPACTEEMLERMDLDLVDKQIIDEKCADEDFELLQEQIDITNEDLENENERRALQIEALEKLKEKHNALNSDVQTIKAFIEESKRFDEKTQMKIETIDKEIEVKKTIIAKKKEEMQKLQDKVHSQKISIEEKEKLTKEKHDLARMIQLYDTGIREFEKSAFTVDLKFAEDQRKLEKLIVEYNKLLAEKVIVEPRLKDVEVKFSLLNNTDDSTIEVVDNKMKKLKDEYKVSLHALESKKSELENILWRAKQDENETEEEIAKETALLEGVECDLEKQEELINKESQKIKEERNRWLTMAKDITDELTQFDSDKLEEKKVELKKLEHDWQLIQQLSKELLDGEMELIQEGVSKVKVSVDKINKATKNLQKTLE